MTIQSPRLVTLFSQNRKGGSIFGHVAFGKTLDDMPEQITMLLFLQPYVNSMIKGVPFYSTSIDLDLQ